MIISKKKMIKISILRQPIASFNPLHLSFDRNARGVTHPVHKRAGSTYGGRCARRRMFPTCYVKVLNSPCNFDKREKEVDYPRIYGAHTRAPFAKQRDRLTNSSTRFASSRSAIALDMLRA